jgi:hypothetical protein
MRPKSHAQRPPQLTTCSATIFQPEHDKRTRQDPRGNGERTADFVAGVGRYRQRDEQRRTASSIERISRFIPR